MPFKSIRDDEAEYKKMIQGGDYDLNTKQWKNISKEAKDLVSKLLTVDPKIRISAKEALEHPWIQHKVPPEQFNLDIGS
jgi:serine/threonine protein kinase